MPACRWVLLRLSGGCTRLARALLAAQDTRWWIHSAWIPSPCPASAPLGFRGTIPLGTCAPLGLAPRGTFRYCRAS
jgi:hypothetical protein